MEPGLRRGLLFGLPVALAFWAVVILILLWIF